MQRQRRVRFLTGIGVLGLLSLFMIPLTAGAQTATPNNVGGSTIYVFCLDYGKTFPQGRTIMAQGLADDRVRGALAYALGKGYVTSDPYEVQLAIWNLRDGQPFHDVNNRGTARAQEIVMNAGTVPAGNAGDVGNLTVSNIQSADANNAYGTGMVSGMLPPNAPIGFVLPAPDASFQGLVSVVASPMGGATTPPAAAAASSTNTPAPTVASTNTPAPTVASTNTPAPTIAPTNTPAPTVAPTSTLAATNTPAATATCTPASTTAAGSAATVAAGTPAGTAGTGAATTAARVSPTCAPTPVATGTGGGVTPTTAPAPTATCVSMANATGTASRTTPTTLPTVRAAATNATGANATCAPTPVATGTGGGTTPTTLPQTGAPRDANGLNGGMLLALVAACFATGTGIALRRRTSRAR